MLAINCACPWILGHALDNLVDCSSRDQLNDQRGVMVYALMNGIVSSGTGLSPFQWQTATWTYLLRWPKWGCRQVAKYWHYFYPIRCSKGFAQCCSNFQKALPALYSTLFVHHGAFFKWLYISQILPGTIWKRLFVDGLVTLCSLAIELTKYLWNVQHHAAHWRWWSITRQTYRQGHKAYRWLRARLQYIQRVSNGYIAILL